MLNSTNYNFKQSTLMHKNIPVADIEMTIRKGAIVAIKEVYHLAHAPLGTLSDFDGRLHVAKLDDWLTGRSIPASRQNVERLLRDLDVGTPTALALQSFALSLSDHYWVKPKNMEITWEDVNFFDNDFSEDIGKILFSEIEGTSVNINVKSPDNSSDGMLQKRWTIQNNKRVLVKGADGRHSLSQEPFNEVIASLLMAELGIHHVMYEQQFIKNKPYSLCEIFTDRNTEYITAWSVLKHFKRDKKLSEYEQLLENCLKLGMDDMRSSVEKMLVIDYIIANTDRHYGNFGFIRDANTLEFLGFAPIFDSGASLWCDGGTISHLVPSKPFKQQQMQQIKLVQDLSWFKEISPEKVSDIIGSVLSVNTPVQDLRMGISQMRIEKIIQYVNERLRHIYELRI